MNRWEIFSRLLASLGASRGWDTYTWGKAKVLLLSKRAGTILGHWCQTKQR